MARLFEDGFDHYGLDETNMLDGVYAQAEQVLSAAQVATGTHSIYFSNTNSVFGSGGCLRKVLPAAKDKMGAMARFYFPDAPHDHGRSGIFCFMTASPTRSQISVSVDANGCLRFYRGATGADFTASGTLIAQSDPIIVMSAWNHIEVQVYIHDTEGWVRAAVNGVHRYEATGLDTKYNADNIVSVSHMISYLSGFAGSTADFYMDDLILYDFVGDSAVDTDFVPTTDGAGKATGYIGELQVMWLPPNGDTAEADWAKSSGADGYALVDETTPNDADYIFSSAAADLTEFALTDLPEEITYIRGLTVWGRMSKSDAGAAMIRFGMKSVAAVTDAPERPVTVEPTYWWDQVNLDPNSAARWTRASLNAGWMRLTRSA
jgi:hypothetical protein